MVYRAVMMALQCFSHREDGKGFGPLCTELMVVQTDSAAKIISDNTSFCLLPVLTEGTKSISLVAFEGFICGVSRTDGPNTTHRFDITIPNRSDQIRFISPFWGTYADGTVNSIATYHHPQHQILDSSRP